MNSRAPDHEHHDVAPLPPHPWRKPLLLLGGGALLTLGLLLQLGAPDDTAPSEEVPIDDDMLHVETRSLRFEVLDSGREAGRGEASTRHAGEEGKLGRPNSDQASGLYALRGPVDAQSGLVPAYEADPRAAGIVGVMDHDSGHFLASPHSTMPVGGGLGLSGTGRGGGGFDLAQHRTSATGEQYRAARENAFVDTRVDAKSTFSIDVDTASYANVRRFLLRENRLPPPEAVRVEELVNYFDYDYAYPDGDAPFAVTTEVGPCPWAPEHRLVHIGVQGHGVEAARRPRNLVFLIDTSGSMQLPDKLPLIQRGLGFLTEHLDARDRISIVAYAGEAGVVLPPTSGADKVAIHEALSRLESGGGTNGSAGILLAYALAQEAFVEDGINRVVLATDGDFNLGVTSHDDLIELIRTWRKSNIFLSVLGVGTDNLHDHTMEQLADQGNGNYAYIDGVLEARKVLVEEAGATLVTIAKDVKIQVEFDPRQVVRHRLVGYENRMLAHRDFDDDTKDAGEIGSGHTVTALYEIETVGTVRPNTPIMTLSMRYKAPHGDASRKVVAPVVEAGATLERTSTDYRFAAAVAAFGQKLRGSATQAETTYAGIFAQARDSIGADPHGYRHQFLEMVHKAAELSGEHIDEPLPRGEQDSSPPHRTQRIAQLDEARSTTVFPRTPVDEEPWGLDLELHHTWSELVLPTLRLLPPLLALPLFVMAFRNPRRRRRDTDA